MTQTHNFDYQSARECFLTSVTDAGVDQLVSSPHPLLGPDGEIAMDVARFGPDNADHVLVISAGTHGIEGYCGSYIQCELLKRGLASRLPSNLQLILIHGINPFGFAWRRRVNEGNIDLNRNFVDHSNAPTNAGYAELASILEPKTWDEATKRDMWQDIFRVAAEHAGEPGWQGLAITGGQNEFPGGVFYSGQAPAWSNRKILELSAELTGKRVTWLDIHTALGAYGDGEFIVEYQMDSVPLARAKSLWGDRVRNTKTNESVASDIDGSMSVGTHALLGDDLVFVGLEYGTVRGKQVLEAIIGDQWLHRYGDRNSAQGKQIKQEMMDAFFPDAQDWRDSVYEIAIEAVEPVLRVAAEN